MYSHGAFFPLPAFSNRVQHVGLGGLTIRHVTLGDAGNYTIEVNGRDLFARHTIILTVSGNFKHRLQSESSVFMGWEVSE